MFIFSQVINQQLSLMSLGQQSLIRKLLEERFPVTDALQAVRYYNSLEVQLELQCIESYEFTAGILTVTLR